MYGRTIKCPCLPSLTQVTRSSPVHQNHETLDAPCKQHCEEADSPHSRMYRAFPSLLPCNDDLHSDFRTRVLFGRNWFEFLSAEYLRPRAKMTHRICLHFSSMPFCAERKRERRAHWRREVCTTNFVVVREQIDSPIVPDYSRIPNDCIPILNRRTNRGRDAAHMSKQQLIMHCFLLVMFLGLCFWYHLLLPRVGHQFL